MSDLPEPREDGLCVDCEKTQAVTTDRRWCLGCLRKRVNESTPIVSTFSDQRGRKAKSTQVLGGQAEMGSDGDEW